MFSRYVIADLGFGWGWAAVGAYSGSLQREPTVGAYSGGLQLEPTVGAYRLDYRFRIWELSH